jgi:DNA-directed RNA polymerase specialized sigma24 family protein
MTSDEGRTDSEATESQRAENDLIDGARAGDASAFDELVGRHLRRAYAVAYRLLGQRQDAEDVVQDACLAALVWKDTRRSYEEVAQRTRSLAAFLGPRGARSAPCSRRRRNAKIVEVAGAVQGNAG